MQKVVMPELTLKMQIIHSGNINILKVLFAREPTWFPSWLKKIFKV